MDLYFIFLLAIIAECSFINPNHSTNFSAVIGPVCLDSDLWSLPTFSARDCQIALQNLLNGDVSTYGEEVFDFMVAGATSRTRLRKVQLPAAYDYGELKTACTIKSKNLSYPLHERLKGYSHLDRDLHACCCDAGNNPSKLYAAYTTRHIFS